MNLFLSELVNMSLVASLLIAAVLLLRFVLRKAPKAIICVLWAMVGLRLVCPFSFESKLSLVPEAEPITYISQFDASDLTEQPVYKKVVSFEANAGSVVVRTEDTTEFDFTGLLIKLAPYIWGGGVAVMAASSVVSYVRLRRRLVVSVNTEDNIWRCDGIRSPFILGIFKPKIYVPSHLNEEEQRVVVAHEKAHLKRLDHLWKPLGYLILTLHWFNPLGWVAYAMLCRDIEGACDEKVVRQMSGEDKKLYSTTLLLCSAPRHIVAACPVAFGEVSVKGRVRSVLSYKKPAFWIIVTAVVAAVFVAAVFMTNPVKPKTLVCDTETELLQSSVINANKTENTESRFACESHEILEREERGSFITYYMLVNYGEYFADNGSLESCNEKYSPVVLTTERTSEGKYKLLEYWTPEDSENYNESVKEKFPANHYDKVIYGVSFKNTLQKECESKASEHFEISEGREISNDYPRFVGEIVSVDDVYYLVEPLDNESALWAEYDKVYVSRNAEYGTDADYIKGDYVQVCYENEMLETEPPVLPEIKSISLYSKVFSRMEPRAVEYYREYEGGDVSIYAVAGGSVEELEKLEVYRYMPETPMPPRNVPENGKVIYNDRFAPYLCLDYSTGYATFAYGTDQTIIGLFEENNGKLVVDGFHYGLRFFGSSNDYTEEYVFYKTPEGYALDAESSGYLNVYRYELDGKIYEDLPSGAVFEKINNLVVA